MKNLSKIVSVLLACMLLLSCVPAMAEDVPEGYPEIKIDPATGKPYDLGGMEIWIYDWWSPADGSRAEATNAQTQDMYDYQDWLMETYNFTMKQGQNGDWEANPQLLLDFASAETAPANAIFLMRPECTFQPISNGMLYDLTTFDCVDMTAEKWNPTLAGVYGTSIGTTEVRNVLLFNKALVKDAGIDPDSIYQMVADGTWNFEAFEAILEKCQRDTDNDGVIDVYAMASNHMDYYTSAVFSNGGQYFGMDKNGKIYIAANEAEALDGLNFANDTYLKYNMPQPAGSNWDWYFAAFKTGQAAFHAGQFWEIQGSSAALSGLADEFEFGVVPFPKGNSEKAHYSNPSNINTYVLPKNIDEESAWKIMFAFNLWTEPTPGYEEDGESWKDTVYNDCCDDESVDITYAILRESAAVNYTALVGSDNDILGQDFIWNLAGGDGTPAEKLEVKMPVWQAICDELNK